MEYEYSTCQHNTMTSQWHHAEMSQSKRETLSGFDETYSAFTSNVCLSTVIWTSVCTSTVCKLPFQSWIHYVASWLSPAHFLLQHLHIVPGRRGEHLHATQTLIYTQLLSCGQGSYCAITAVYCGILKTLPVTLKLGATLLSARVNQMSPRLMQRAADTSATL